MKRLRIAVSLALIVLLTTSAASADQHKPTTWAEEFAQRDAKLKQIGCVPSPRKDVHGLTGCRTPNGGVYYPGNKDESRLYPYDTPAHPAIPSSVPTKR